MSHGNWMTYRSFTADQSVKNRSISRSTARRIVGYARPYRTLVIAFLITLVFESLLVVAQPLLFRRIVDQGITPGNTTVVVVTALLVALVAIVDAGLGLVSRFFSARIGEGLIYDLRVEVFAHVQRQSVAFFTRAQTGSLVSRLNNDVIGAQQAFTSTLSGVLGNLISLVVVLVTMFLLSWQITLASLVLVPLFLLPARWMGRRLQAMTRERMQLNSDMSSQMTERFNVAGALLVKLFGRPDEEDALFSGKAAKVRDTGVSIAMSNRVFMTSLTLVAALATALVYGAGGSAVVAGAMTLGTLLALVGLLAQLYGPLTALSNVRVDVMTALVSFERVFEVLDLKPLVPEPDQPAALPDGPLEVRFDHVGFTYPTADEVSLASLEGVARPEASGTGEPVLHDVSFTAAPGAMVALVGPSGSGKTTITALTARLYDPTDGIVRIGGVDLRTLARDDLQPAIGVVTQDAHMFHDTIRANLLYARPDATDAELTAALRDAQILPLIESLPDGLDTVVGDRGYRLSGGEKQRLAIARILLKAPRIVVLDEATAHLDSESEAAVSQALDTALHGRTALVIAHRLSTVRNANLILVLEDGRVIESGTHHELLEQGGLYADLYRTQFRHEHPDAAATGAVGSG